MGTPLWVGLQIDFRIQADPLTCFKKVGRDASGVATGAWTNGWDCARWSLAVTHKDALHKSEGERGSNSFTLTYRRCAQCGGSYRPGDQ
jgi:hypothetical protein